MIHVCYGLHDRDGRFSKFTGTSMLSLFENISYPPPSVTVHILHDETLTQDNYGKFIYIAGRYGQAVKFYNVEKICAEKISELKSLAPNAPHFFRASIGSLYRMLIPFALPQEIEKIIYLDSDTIINLDIAKLWKFDVKEKIFAAVPEIENGLPTKEFFALCRDGFVKGEDYFNAGVLLINLNQFKNEMPAVLDGIKFVTDNPPYIYGDQDVLNYCFSTRILKLPLKFNKFTNQARQRNDIAIKNEIYHYAGGGLSLNLQDNFNRLWFKYFELTPFFGVETIEHLYEGVRQLYVERQNFAMKVSAVMSGRQRAFFISPENFEAVKKIFFVNGDEEIIIATPDSIQNLCRALKKSRGKKIFFLLVENYFEVGKKLIEAGYVESEDFLNAAMFLSDANGVPLNSYPLVKIM